MELQENSIIVSDRLDGVFDVELRNHFTHAYCTAGECELTYNGRSSKSHQARLDGRVVTDEGDSQLEREGKAELYESSSRNHFIRLRYSLGEQPRVRVT